MTPGGSTVVGSLFLVAALTGAAAGVHAVDLGTRIDEAIDGAVDRTLRDLTVGWLEVTDARGVVEDDAVHEIQLVVRLDGAARTLDTRDLTVVTVGAANATLDDVDALRDPDASTEDGRITQDDLVRLTFALDEPVGAQETLALEMHEDGKAPLILTVTTPLTLSEPYATLETNVAW